MKGEYLPDQSLSVLLLCDDFPPYGGIRSGAFVKYLPDSRIIPLVIAWRDEGIPDHKFDTIDQELTEKVLWVSWTRRDQATWLEERKHLRNRAIWLFCPELSRPPGLYGALIRYMLGLRENGGISTDFILVSTSCFDPLIRVGRDLAKLWKVPWAADLRDIVEERDTSSCSMREKFYLFRARLRRNNLLRSASFVTVVSETHQRILQRSLRMPVHLLYNGFDPELFDVDSPCDFSSPHFVITYTGSVLYERVRRAELFFQGCQIFLSRHDVPHADIRVRFYGHDSHLAEKYGLEHGCADVIETYDRVLHSEMPQIMGQASVLLVLTSDLVRGVMTSKFFEYVATGKPILCVPRDDGAIADLLTRHDLGYAGDSPGEIASYLSSQYNRWKRHELEPRPIPQDLRDLFSRKDQTKKLASWIRGSLKMANRRDS